MNKTVSDYPKLLARWDYEKNPSSPDMAMRKSKEKAWFKCPICGISEEHVIAYMREHDGGCRICRGNKYYFLGKDGTYAVYAHTTPDGKKYIGMTQKPIKIRFGNGKCYFASGFKEAIKRFGWENISHEILEYGLTEEEASACEIKYINLYNTLDPDYGYNIATGGKHGKVYGRAYSAESRKRISDAHKGKKLSQETRRKLSEAHKGKEGNNKRAVIKMDRSGREIEEYPSIQMAAINNGIKCRQNIYRVCIGLRKTAGGFAWKYKS